MGNSQHAAKAHDTNAWNTTLFFAATDLESATYAARKAREDLRRATRNRLAAKERHDDARTAWGLADVEDGQLYGFRVELLAWALDDAKTAEADALEDYRSALKRIEAVGAAAGGADSPDVPSSIRQRARRAIALADSFGNKVAMDATLHDGLERPVLPELEPEVEVQEFPAHQGGEPVRTKVLDPLEQVDPPRATLVPVDDYEGREDVPGSLNVTVEKSWETEEGVMVQGTIPEPAAGAIRAGRLEDASVEDPAAGGWKPEHMSPEWWKQVTYSEPLNAKDPLPEPDEDLSPVCPECRDGKCKNCDGTAWDDVEDAPASCSHECPEVQS